MIDENMRERAAILIATVGLLDDEVPMPVPAWAVRLVARILVNVDREREHERAAESRAGAKR